MDHSLKMLDPRCQFEYLNQGKIWARIAEQIVWSFSALRFSIFSALWFEVGPLGRIRKAEW